MVETIYLHVGVHKTGTSAIQSFLNHNRERLVRDYSCLYPTFNSPSFDRGITQHNQCPLFRKYSQKTITNKIMDVIRNSERKGIKQIVFSCEELFGNSDYAELLGGIFKTQGIPCRVIVYVRRQDHWFESAWKQWGVKDKNANNIEDYISQNPIAWLEYLISWASLFGKDNIIVHAYEREQLPQGLINDFLSVLNIDARSDRWDIPKKKNLHENFGFDRDILEIYRLNTEFYDSVHDVRLFNLFSDYLPDNYMKKPFEPYSLLSPAKRLEVLHNYEPINKTIAQEYMGRPDGRLFFEPWPDPGEPWEPYPGLTVEKIVPIFTQMLYSMDRKYRTQLKALSVEVRENPKFVIKMKKIGSSLIQRMMNVEKD